MEELVQTILVPIVDEVPHAAIAYAKMLSKAYAKPVALLCSDAILSKELEVFDYPVAFSKKSFALAIQETVIRQDAVMVVFESNGKRRLIQRQLSACRDFRIPYFFIPKSALPVAPVNVILPMSFLIEEREKAIWGRSFYRYFKSEFTLLKPNDRGSRAAKNVIHVEEFFHKHSIQYTTMQGRLSSFKNGKEALARLSEWGDLMILTASREYGLDDSLLGPRELHVLRKSKLPIMMLNPREDLYVLCGD